MLLRLFQKIFGTKASENALVVWQTQDESAVQYIGMIGVVVSHEVGNSERRPHIIIEISGPEIKGLFAFYSNDDGQDEIITLAGLWLKVVHREPTAEELDAFLAIAEVDAKQAIAFVKQVAELMI